MLYPSLIGRAAVPSTLSTSPTITMMAGIKFEQSARHFASARASVALLQREMQRSRLAGACKAQAAQYEERTKPTLITKPPSMPV